MTDQTSRMDLGPAAARVTALLSGVSDDQLGSPTPCPAYSVGDLLDHFMGLAIGMRQAAEKAPGEDPGQGRAGRLASDWREELPRRLDAMAAAWRDPAAWQGTTQAGGVTLPAEVMGIVALDELVIHGWDLARATGQPYDCAPGCAEAIAGWLSAFPDEEQRGEAFGAVVPVPKDAPALDRAIGLSGRDPAWSP
ncbi:TIGR03086 family metal-binding protein [Streptomyces sp. NPDC059850]|uniref:TIGR03086 family metal-binding protein n=1 Tax=Streptomyces sp. NPDC059850 TaxID=3346970 RepID=UPI00365FC9CB